MSLCPAQARPEWNFVRRFHCSFEEGHTSPHRAYWDHDINGDVAWVGPWDDGSYYIVCEDMGIKEWKEPKSQQSALL